MKVDGNVLAVVVYHIQLHFQPRSRGLPRSGA